MGNVTMKDLARELGVSVTTVSNAYSHPDRLSAALREKIIARGEELGYCGPDAVGRLLRSGRAHAIGALCGKGYAFSFRDEYSMTMMGALARELEAQGVALTLLPTGFGEDNVDAVAAAVVDGFVSMSARTDSEAVKFAKRRGLRVVFGHMAPEHDFVSGDDFSGGHMLGELVARAGHKNVAIVHIDSKVEYPQVVETMDEFCGVDTDKYWGRTRAEGIREALGPAVKLRLILLPGQGADPEVVKLDRAGVPQDNLDFVLGLDDPPTALMCLSDRIAMHLMDAMEARGVVPGEDLSITGYDGIKPALDRGLTTIVQPIEEKGRRTAQLLLAKNPTETQIVLDVELVEGETVKPPKV